MDGFPSGLCATTIRRGSAVMIAAVIAIVMVVSVTPVRANAAPAESAQDRYFELIDQQVARDGIYSTSSVILSGVPERFALEFAAGLEVSGESYEVSEGLAAEVDRLTGPLRSYHAARAACGGRNGVDGPTILLDSCSAAAVQNALTAGAGIAGIAAIITSSTGVGAAIAGALAAYLAAQGGIVGLCNSWGTGVRLFPIPGTIWWGCLAQ